MGRKRINRLDFEEGELDFLPKNQVKEFVKDRFNRSLESIVKKF